MNDHEFIRKFLSIKLNYVCKENNYNIANIMNGTASKDKMHNCRVLIEDMLYQLLVDSKKIGEENGNNNDICN